MEKICRSVVSSNTNPTLYDLGLKPGPHPRLTAEDDLLISSIYDISSTAYCKKNPNEIRALSQIVNEYLTTAEQDCKTLEETVELGWGFLRVLRLPLPILIPSTALHSLITLSIDYICM
jgi:hypothetical protein